MSYRAYTNPEFIRLLKKKLAYVGTYAVFGQKINVEKHTICNWVNGRYPPSPKIARKLQEVYGIKMKISRPDLFDNRKKGG